MSSVTKSGYRDLMTRAFLLWAVVSLASKAPVAMAPLALVFLSRESPGGYTLGATLASVYVLGEVVGAPCSALGWPAAVCGANCPPG